MSEEHVTVWVTEYALTRGVMRMSGTLRDGRFRARSLTGSVSHADWHLDEDSARRRVVELISARRKALLQQLEKLDKFSAELATGRLPKEEK